jgi:tetratricopeptide (TPR) repeat protein
MACPRCGFAEAGDVSCPLCGVVFSKLAGRPGAARRPRPVREAGSPLAPWLWMAVAAAAIAGGIAVVVRPGPPAAAAPPRVALPAPGRAPAADALPPPPFGGPAPAASPPALELRAEGLSAEDRSRARALASRMGTAGSREVQEAEDLQARFPGDPEMRRLLGSVLLAAAQRARAGRRTDEAAAWLQKAASIAADPRPWLLLVDVLGEAGDWTGAEAAARGALAMEPRNATAWKALGYALLRQDRGREASEALRASLAIEEDAAARALLARVEKGLDDESGMRQQTLSHFNVRYDGDAHESVGREILRALERHHATLAGTLDHQPAVSIPVILFTGQAYYDASGAPAWSGGAYDTLDGRIRIPIGGLTPSLTPDIDGTLLHELTHAFVADRTRGVAPRDIHEGLAQYMEGKRSEAMLGPEGMAALADGRLTGVGGFYLAALSFVEYLMAQRGQGGMNDLLRAMAETRSVDEAFQSVHGRRLEETRRMWRERLKQQFGS